MAPDPPQISWQPHTHMKVQLSVFHMNSHSQYLIGDANYIKSVRTEELPGHFILQPPLFAGFGTVNPCPQKHCAEYSTPISTSVPLNPSAQHFWAQVSRVICCFCVVSLSLLFVWISGFVVFFGDYLDILSHSTEWEWQSQSPILCHQPDSSVFQSKIMIDDTILKTRAE